MSPNFHLNNSFSKDLPIPFVSRLFGGAAGNAASTENSAFQRVEIDSKPMAAINSCSPSLREQRGINSRLIPDKISMPRTFLRLSGGANDNGPDNRLPAKVDFDSLENSWQLSSKHSNEHFEVYTAAVEGEPLSALRGVTIFKTTKERLFPVLLDVKNYPQWMDGVTRTYLLDEGATDLCDYVTIADSSWPFRPRYDVLHPSLRDIDENESHYMTRSDPQRGLPEFLKKKEGRKMERLGHSECRFMVEQLSDNEVKFTYDIHVGSDDKVNHRFLRFVDPLISNLMGNTMDRLRNYLESEGVIE